MNEFPLNYSTKYQYKIPIRIKNRNFYKNTRSMKKLIILKMSVSFCFLCFCKLVFLKGEEDENYEITK